MDESNQTDSAQFELDQFERTIVPNKTKLNWFWFACGLDVVHTIRLKLKKRSRQSFSSFFAGLLHSSSFSVGLLHSFYIIHGSPLHSFSFSSVGLLSFSVSFLSLVASEVSFNFPPAWVEACQVFDNLTIFLMQILQLILFS